MKAGVTGSGWALRSLRKLKKAGTRGEKLAAIVSRHGEAAERGDPGRAVGDGAAPRGGRMEAPTTSASSST